MATDKMTVQVSLAEAGGLLGYIEHKWYRLQEELGARLIDGDAIDVTVARHLTDARQSLIAERDENTCRLDMKPSEKVALGLALEELERPAAAERKAAIASRDEKGRATTTEEKFPSVGERTGKVYDLVGESVGMSGTTYSRAKRVVAEAEAGDPIAEEALAEMDRTGKVTPAHRRYATAVQDGTPGSHRLPPVVAP